MKFNKLIVLTSVSTLSFLLIHGGAMAADNPMQQVDGGEDLEKVKKGKFSETYVNPGVDFSRYDKIYIGEAIFDYRKVKSAKRTSGIYSNTTSKAEYPISEEDRQQFEEIVSEVFRAEIIKGQSYTIVDAENADENTLIMRGVVADIVSQVPPSNVRNVNVYMPSVGAATLGLEFLDGTTGEVLARVAERGRIGDARRQIDRTSRPVNRATVIADIKRWASGAARKLRQALDSALES